MFNLEQSIAEWRRQMLAAGIKTPVPLEELESHLREEIEQQMKSGLSEQEVFDSAVQKIGQAHIVQNEFKKVGATREVIRLTLVTLGVVLMLIGIPFLKGLGFGLMLLAVADELLQHGRRRWALFLLSWWTVTGVLNLVLLLQKEGAFVHAFVREPLPLWYRAVFVCIWLGCIISHFWQRRSPKHKESNPTVK